MGLGDAVRDHRGNILFSAVRRTKAWWPSDVAECKAIFMVVSWAKKYGRTTVIIESNAQGIISRFSAYAIFFSDLDAILEDVLALCASFNSISFSHVRRDGNSVAHHLARLIPFGVEQIWVDHCPYDLAPYVLMENLSLS